MRQLPIPYQLLALCLLIRPVGATAQTAKSAAKMDAPGASASNFLGTISYKMDLKNLPEGINPAMLEAMIPSKMEVHIRDGVASTTTNSAMMSKAISSTTSDTNWIVMDGMRRVFWMTQKEADALGQTGKSSKPNIKKTTETETILGYPATKHIITMEAGGKNSTTIAWVTDRIITPKSRVKAQSDGMSMLQNVFEGTVLRMDTKMQGIDMHLEATAISTTPPPAEVFTLPANYEREAMTIQNIQRAAMNSMGK